MKTYFDMSQGGIVFRTVPIRYERDELGEGTVRYGHWLLIPNGISKNNTHGNLILQSLISAYSAVSIVKNDGVGTAHPCIWISKKNKSMETCTGMVCSTRRGDRALGNGPEGCM